MMLVANRCFLVARWLYSYTSFVDVEYDLMQAIFKIFMLIQVTLYKLTNGAIGGRFNGGDLLLLTATGRKSGKTRTTPLMYIKDGERYLVTATAGGSNKNPGWYWNVTQGTQPVQIQVKDKVMRVTVAEAQGEQHDQLYQRFIDMNEQFAGYLKKTTRTIPVLILTPQS